MAEGTQYLDEGNAEQYRDNFDNIFKKKTYRSIGLPHKTAEQMLADGDVTQDQYDEAKEKVKNMREEYEREIND